MASSPRVLLLGGHGRVSMLMTPKIVAKSWALTSVIRNAEQREELLQAGARGPGKVNVLVASLDEVKSQSDAQRILDQTTPDWVIWSAGAGGKGGPSRTYAIDRDACSHFIRAVAATASVKKFLLISALSIRRNRAPWFDDADWAAVQKGNTETLPDYYKAKLAAEDVLTVLCRRRKAADAAFQWVSLRPGTLSEEPETGSVALGKTTARGKVPRGDVAEAAVRILEDGRFNGWIDLMSGEEDIDSAIGKAVNDQVDCVEGEDIKLIESNVA